MRLLRAAATWWTAGAAILARPGPLVKALRSDLLFTPTRITGSLCPDLRHPSNTWAITSNSTNRPRTNRSSSFENSFTQRLGAANKGPRTIMSASDCRPGLRVENVKPGRAHGNAQLVAHLHPRGRLDARHHDTFADLHIEQDFRAELLDHLDHGIEARLIVIGGARHGEVLRAHAERDLVADMAAQALRSLVRQLDAQTGVLGHQRSVRLGHRNGGEIHGRGADEAGDELVGRLIVQLERLPHLLHHAVLHDDDPVTQRHGLDLVVGNVNGGGTETQMQLLELNAHLHPQLGIEVRQRLVEQEHAGVAHDGTAQSHPLALAAGELARLAL